MYFSDQVHNDPNKRRTKRITNKADSVSGKLHPEQTTTQVGSIPNKRRFKPVTFQTNNDSGQ